MIEVKDLHGGYRHNPVLKGLSFRVPERGLSVLLGPNGAGKSTLLYALLGYLKTTKGQIFIKGKELKEYSRPQLAHIIAFIPQEQKSEFDYSVLDTVLMGRYPFMKLMQSYTEEDLAEAERVMKLMRIEHFRHRFMGQLSGGEKQRVYLARALIQNTDYIFLDESLSQLDINYQIEIMKLLKELSHSQNKGILLVSHNINLSANFADWMLFLRQGQLLKMGTPEELMQSHIVSELYNFPLELMQNPHTGTMNIIYPKE